VHLSEQAAEIVDLFDGVGGDDDAHRAGGDLAEIGQVGGVTLHADLCRLSARTHVGDLVGVGVDRDGFGA